jgi:EmrB/QacA subfamily drug resistance transporter
VLAVCCISLFLTGLDSTIVIVGLPEIGRSLHAGVSGLQWSVAAYTVTLASLLMSSGAAADRVGRRTIFQAGLSLFVLSSWLCSVAPTLGSLIAFRALQGAGGSMLNPAALGIITSTFTRPAERARAIGAWDGVFGLSMTLGPVLGGILVGFAGWRAVFWANIPVGLTALALTALLVPESRASRPRRPDPAGQVLVTVMVAALAAAIIEAPGRGWLSPVTTGLFTLAAAALAPLLYLEPRRAEPLIQFGYFRSAPFAGANLTAVCAVAAMAGFLFLSTLYLQDVRGMSALRAGLTILPMPAEMALCAPLAGRIIARRGSRIPAAAAGIALAASSAVLTRLTPSSSPEFLALTYSLFGAGAGLISPVITYGVMSGVPDGQAGLASGINSSSRQLGQCLGVAVTGTLLAGALHGPMRSGFVPAAHAAWWVMAGCGLAVLAAGLATTSRRTAPAAAGTRGQARWLLRAVPGPRSRQYPARHARPRRTCTRLPAAIEVPPPGTAVALADDPVAGYQSLLGAGSHGAAGWAVLADMRDRRGGPGRAAGRD